jgi:hypothetical protein
MDDVPNRLADFQFLLEEVGQRRQRLGDRAVPPDDFASQEEARLGLDEGRFYLFRPFVDFQGEVDDSSVFCAFF